MNWKKSLENKKMQEISKTVLTSVTVNIQCNKSYFPNSICLDNITISVTSGSTYESVLQTAGIPVEEVGFISVNGVKKEKEEIVCENDSIRPLPLIICG
jgi:repressor of nif and glnA expression